MSLFSEIQAAALEAQSTLAQLQGMTAGGSNVLYRGTAYVGTFGPPQVVEIMNPAGGYRKRFVVTLTITRSQMEEAPDTKEQIIRTDIDPNLTYRIDTVDSSDVLHWVLALVKVGE
jgi:hypothetical protein